MIKRGGSCHHNIFLFQTVAYLNNFFSNIIVTISHKRLCCGIMRKDSICISRVYDEMKGKESDAIQFT